MTIVRVLWITWIMILLLSIRNPLYLLLIGSCLFLAGGVIAAKKKITGWIKRQLAFVLSMLLLSTLINALLTHTGGTRLFQIPPSWPLIGGSVTLEGVIFGSINGLIIAALFLLFNILNLVLRNRDLIRLIPKAFHPIAMLLSIGLTFFPSIQKRTQEIKEAQIIRGNPMRKLRDWLPLFMPLLISSLENAIQLSESMVARGFSPPTTLRDNQRALIGLISAIFLVFSGWVLQLYAYEKFISISLYAASALIILIVLLRLSRASKITTFHQEEFTLNHILLAALSIILMLAFLILQSKQYFPTFNYSPYPSFSLPDVRVPELIICVSSLIPLGLPKHD